MSQLSLPLDDDPAWFDRTMTRIAWYRHFQPGGLWFIGAALRGACWDDPYRHSRDEPFFFLAVVIPSGAIKAFVCSSDETI
jgi:hypothetical protein